MYFKSSQTFWKCIIFRINICNNYVWSFLHQFIISFYKEAHIHLKGVEELQKYIVGQLTNVQNMCHKHAKLICNKQIKNRWCFHPCCVEKTSMLTDLTCLPVTILLGCNSKCSLDIAQKWNVYETTNGQDNSNIHLVIPLVLRRRGGEAS